MRKILGVILIIVGFITLPQIISPSAPEVFGGFIGISIVTFLPAYFLLRSKKEKKLVLKQESLKTNISRPLVNSVPKETFWENFKILSPHKANNIEAVTKLNFSILNDKDAREKVESLVRWSNNSEIPIPILKQDFLNNFISTFSEEELPKIRESLVNEQIKEAGVFGISKQNTGTSFMFKWFEEYMEEANKHKFSNTDDSIFFIAKLGAQFIDTEFENLSDRGYGEAILFFCAVLFMIDLESEVNIEEEYNIIEDEFPRLFKGYFVSKDEIKEFIKTRLSFYDNEYSMLRFTHSHYTPLFVYNAFYDMPFTRDTESLKINTTPIETIFLFNTYLNRAFSYVKQFKG